MGHGGQYKKEKIMNVKDMVINNQQVEFLRFQQNELWYKTENGFEFPVPIEDTGSAEFKPKDKAILFMRWIKRHLDSIEQGRIESSNL